MTRRTAIGLLVFCVLGLVSVRPVRVRPLPPAHRARVHELLLDQRHLELRDACTKAGSAPSAACRWPSPASSGSSARPCWRWRRGAAASDCRRSFRPRRAAKARRGVRSGRRADRFADYAPLVPVRVVGRRPRVRDVLRVRLVRRAEDRLRAVPADLRVGHRDFHPVWIRNGPLHALTPRPCPARSARAHDLSRRARRGVAVRRVRRERRRLLPSPAGGARGEGMPGRSPPRRRRSNADAAGGSSRSTTCSQPRVPLPVANDGAKVVIVKFNDYMCPPCKQTFLEYKPILARWQASASPGW